MQWHTRFQSNKWKQGLSHLLQHDKQRSTFTILAFSHTVNFCCILCTKPTIKSGEVLALQNRKEILCYDDQFELPICVRSIVFILFLFLKFIFSLLGRWIVNSIVTHSSLCILLRPTKILVSFLGSSFFSTSALIRRRRKGRSTCWTTLMCSGQTLPTLFHTTTLSHWLPNLHTWKLWLAKSSYMKALTCQPFKHERFDLPNLPTWKVWLAKSSHMKGLTCQIFIYESFVLPNLHTWKLWLHNSFYMKGLTCQIFIHERFDLSRDLEVCNAWGSSKKRGLQDTFFQ